MQSNNVARLLSDTQLLIAAQSGDLAARDELPERFGGICSVDDPVNRRDLMHIVALSACRRTGLRTDAHTIADVIAETYHAILRDDLVRFEPRRGTVMAYLVGLALNVAHRVKRMLRRENSIELKPSWPAEDPRIAIEESAHREWAARQALDLLPEELRQPVRRIFWDSQPVAVVAREFGVERTRFHRQLGAAFRHIAADADLAA